MNLENRFFYRLVKVTYIFLVFISCLIGFAFVVNSELLYGILFVGASYAFLNISKDALIYVAFGEKISFQWTIVFQRLFEKSKSIIESNNISTDPQGAAVIVVRMLVDEEKPFSPWEPEPNPSLIDEFKGAASCAGLGYSLYIYLLLIRNKFGKEISSLVKHHLITLLKKGETDAGEIIIDLINIIEGLLESHDLAEVNLLIDDSMEPESMLAPYFLTLWQGSKLCLSHEERARLTTHKEIIDYCGVDSICTVLDCLATMKKEAIVAFKPIINSIKFKPESIRGLAINEEIAWGKNPGCFEKHLKRKCNNPLFHPEKRVVSQAQVDAARERDAAEAAALHEESELFISSVFDKANTAGCFEMADMNEIREGFEELKQRSFQIGGLALDNTLIALDEAKEEVWGSFKSAIANNEDLSKELSQLDEQYKQEVEDIFFNEFVAQIAREDSPIRVDLYESVLSEDTQEIAAFLKAAFKVDDNKNEKDLARFKGDIVKIIKAMFSRGEDMPMLEEKLKVLGVVVS